MFEDDAYWSGQGEKSSVKTTSQDTTKSIDHPVNSSTIVDNKNIDASAATIQSHINVHSLIKSYQHRGHFVADLDPLGITTVPVKEDHGIKRRADESVTKNYFDFSASDMEKEFLLPQSTFIGGSKKTLKLRFVKLNH